MEQSNTFAKQEREFMKDPFRTVFIARLDYNLTELIYLVHLLDMG